MTEIEICWDWHVPIPCCVKTDTTILENILTTSKLTTGTPCGSTPSNMATDMHTYAHHSMYTNIFINSLLKIVPNWKTQMAMSNRINTFLLVTKQSFIRL